MKIKVGDWVRFYHDGKMVIGVVQYTVKDDLLGYMTAQTDIGAVDFRYILEVRGQS
jgi:hypothetical protein